MADEVPSFEGYDEVAPLGHGGMATVWRARQVALDRLVAIKVLDPDQCKDDEDIDRFQSEARAAARMSHPGIVQVYDAFYRDGRFCFVMEYVDGETVGERIRARGRLDQDEALFVAAGIADALAYAWDSQRLVHCDLKPDNVMVGADGTVKVMDFGLARSRCSLQQRHAETGEEYVFGTPSYMPPEQALGSPDLSVQADMYALGATLYHACTGRRLFHDLPPDDVMSAQVNEQDAAPGSLNPSLSPVFCDLLERLLAKEPQWRFPDWPSVSAAIEAVRSGHPVPGPAFDPSRCVSTILRATPRAPGEPPRRAPKRIRIPFRGGAAGRASPTLRERAARLARGTVRVGTVVARHIRRSAVQTVRTASPRPSAGALAALLAAGAVLALSAAFSWRAGLHRERYAVAVRAALDDLLRIPPAECAEFDFPIERIGDLLAEPAVDSLPGLREELEARRADFFAARRARLDDTLAALRAGVAPLAAAGAYDRAAAALRGYTGPYAAQTADAREKFARRLDNRQPL